ncbi:hypothetical protein EB796_024434 [Bugula neritina]|uniref:Uncharacterized protein n=1 Tax=Bugula neritina TaxID=10212 RepID=A0A7J7ITL8_BUGNE|nr:hypothetical protein EB796_024434 [Bugula neritina]
MSSYGGSRHGSRDNLDEYAGQPPQPQPRQPPVPQSRDRSYDRQYVRNQPSSQTESRGAPPAYRQYAGVSRAPVDQTRYSEQASARSHSPGRYIERPQDQYYPSRSQSPSSYAGRGESPARYAEKPRPERSYSPGRALDPGYRGGGYAPSQSGYAPSQSGYAPSQSGYAPSQSGYAPSQSGYAPSQSGYAPSQSGYAPSQSGYAPSQSGYAPQSGRSRGPSASSGYQPAYHSSGRGPAYSQPGQYYPSRGAPRTYNGYQQFGRGYAMKHTKPKHKSVTRDGGYYNAYTDAVIKTKKMKNRGVPTTYLVINRPWSKNHSNQPRDFMPLVIASVFFNPLLGLIALVLSCLTKRAVTEEDWATAGKFGRITFWLSIAAILSGLIFFAILIGSIHNHLCLPCYINKYHSLNQQPVTFLKVYLLLFAEFQF